MPEVVMVNGGCSGFVGFHNVIITAAHCIRDAEDRQEIIFHDGMTGYFKVIALGETDHRDYALLLGDTRGIEPLPLSDTEPRKETQCVSVGHGGANPKQMAIPCETRPKLGFPWNQYIALHSNIIGGDSGSFVAGADDNAVFGIIVRSSFPIPLALAVKISYAKEAYRAYLKEQSK